MFVEYVTRSFEQIGAHRTLLVALQVVEMNGYELTASNV
jgi:hypothetical protein